MSAHEIWHVVVLTSTVLGAAGLALVALTPLVFESPPPGLRRLRPIVLLAVSVALLLFLWEWAFAH